MAAEFDFSKYLRESEKVGEGMRYRIADLIEHQSAEIERLRTLAEDVARLDAADAARNHRLIRIGQAAVNIDTALYSTAESYRDRILNAGRL